MNEINELAEFQGSEKTDQELLDIADRMLAKLEREYWEVQNQNFVMPGSVECPEEEPNPDDYQMLEGDLEGPQHMSDSQEEPAHIDEIQEGAAHAQGTKIVDHEIGQYPQIIGGSDQKDKDVADIGELIEVFPTEEWIPPEKQVNINAQKIKQMTLSMNLPIPDWMKDEEMLRNRVFQLFGKKIK